MPQPARAKPSARTIATIFTLNISILLCSPLKSVKRISGRWLPGPLYLTKNREMAKLLSNPASFWSFLPAPKSCRLTHTHCLSICRPEEKSVLVTRSGKISKAFRSQLHRRNSQPPCSRLLAGASRGSRNGESPVKINGGQPAAESYATEMPSAGEKPVFAYFLPASKK